MKFGNTLKHTLPDSLPKWFGIDISEINDITSLSISIISRVIRVSETII